MIPDFQADVSSRKDVRSSSESTFLHIEFTFLHSTPCHKMHSSHLPRAHQLPENVSHLITQSSPLLRNPFSPLNHTNKLNNNNFQSNSNLPTIVYDHISRLSCLHALGMQPYYNIYSAVLSSQHLSFLPPRQIILPSGPNFTDYEAALYLSLYASLPPHYEYADSNEYRKLTTIPSII